MAFIDRTIGKDEKLIGIASIHWIYAFQGFMWFVGFTFAGMFVDSFFMGFIERFLGFSIPNFFTWMGFLVGLIFALSYFIMWIATEIGLTTKRLIFKRGLIFVDVKELDLEEVKAAEVDNGYFGIFLGYGYLHFDARFVKNLNLPAIAKPYEYLKLINEMRSRIKNGQGTEFLGESKSEKAARELDEQDASEADEQVSDDVKREQNSEQHPTTNGDNGGGPVVFESKKDRRTRMKNNMLKVFKRRTKPKPAS